MQLGERQWPEVADLDRRVVVVPIGSFEQHGHHLPLLTDSMIGAEVARRAEAELELDAVFLPTLWLGASDHHRSFPGTVSLTTETYMRVLQELTESLIGGGFRRILFLNAHAGNINPARQALTEIQIRHRQALPNLYLVFVSWFDLLTPEGLASVDPPLSQTRISHACEWETSVIQSTRPELVADSRPSTRRNFDSPFWCPDFRKGSRVDVFRTLEQSSPSGALGYPERATPEKGEALMALAAREVVALVRDIASWPNTMDGTEEL